MNAEYTHDDLSFGEALLILGLMFVVLAIVEVGDLAAAARRWAYSAAS